MSHCTKINKTNVYSNAKSQWFNISSVSSLNLTKEQKEHFDQLQNDYKQKTINSFNKKIQGQKHLADIRNSIGYSIEKKDLIYPLIAKKSEGSKIWDIDNNEYIDMSMGYGVHLFGHNPDFIVESIRNQLELGLHLGPRPFHITEAAALISEITTHERVAFCSSGTHAISTAIRLARAETGKSKIIMFANSYHGHSVETLGNSKVVNGKITSFPMTIGIPQEIMNDLIILPYNDPDSFSTILDYVDECAAILVEPVQTKMPEIDPKSFLHTLRELTTKNNLILIFDETVTGFRVHIGGAQALFGVKADIATYGKVLGGGLPIGVIVGDAKYLDHIDGGFWNAEDATYPKAEITFFAGTFNQNQLSISSCYTILQKLKAEGNFLYDTLNKKADNMVNILNEYLAEKKCLFKVVNFGSIYRFIPLPQTNSSDANFLSFVMDLFYYHMIMNGTYIWEGRSCYLSTAHTDQDVINIINSVKKSVEALDKAGFLVSNTI